MADSDEEEARGKLKRKLAKLAGVADPLSSAGREIASGPEDALLSALLTEIDETLLARRLTFRTAPGAPALRFEVYGRRLIRVMPPAPDAAAALTDTPLDETSAGSLLAVLTGWLGGASRLFVRADPAPDNRDPLMLGLAAEDLAVAWGLSLDIGRLRSMAFAIEALTELPTVAWVRHETDGTETSAGDPAAVDWLRETDTTALATPPDPDGRATPPRCTVLTRKTGLTLVYAEAAGEMAMLLIQPSEVGAVAGAWRSVIR